jgi:Tfp pilus assembly protein PilX
VSVLAARRLMRRLSDENGIALIMAIAVMLVLTVLVTSALAFTSSDSRDSSRSTATQKAYAAAEAGINDALAAVQKAGSDTSLMPSPPTDATHGGTPTTLTGNATVHWGGSFNSSTQVWTLKAIGIVSNPTGGGAAVITRTITQTARITPPPYSFVALNQSCDNHTLLVETGGDLTVTNAMYIDSCNSPQDAFDIFGTGGNITDPAGIKVVGGWETHNGSTVTSNGTLCPLSNSSTPITATQPAGCPVTGQPVLPDPLASKLTGLTPALGTPACTGATVTNTVAYSPAVTLNAAITAAATSVPIKWGAGFSDPVAVNDVIVVESEDMLVTAVTFVSGTTATLTVTRAYSGTTAAAHNSGKSVLQAVTTVLGTAANPAPCVYTSGTVTLSPGTYYGGICIGSLSSSDCDGANCSTAGTTAAYSPAVTLNAAITATATSAPIKWTSGSDPVAVNDVIQVDSEQMLVTAITPVTSTTATLTVTRAQNGTTGAAHNSGKAVSKYTAPPHVSATFQPGVYILAGGGLRVCGASTLSAPNVLIYNTQDPTQSTGTGALDQIELDTTGSVSLGPQTSGAYEGLTIWQDSGLALDTADSCNSRNNTSSPTQTQINEYDIAFLSAASTGANGSLGSVSGSIYAPANRADFVEGLSGTANLAVLSSCIMINGGNSTFAFNPTGLFGSSWVLGPQAG